MTPESPAARPGPSRHQRGSWSRSRTRRTPTLQVGGALPSHSMGRPVGPTGGDRPQAWAVCAGGEHRGGDRERGGDGRGRAHAAPYSIPADRADESGVTGGSRVASNPDSESCPACRALPNRAVDGGPIVLLLRTMDMTTATPTGSNDAERDTRCPCATSSITPPRCRWCRGPARRLHAHRLAGVHGRAARAARAAEGTSPEIAARLDELRARGQVGRA